MAKPESTVMLTHTQREAYERARLKQISLKWNKIASERAKEMSSPEWGPRKTDAPPALRDAA